MKLEQGPMSSLLKSRHAVCIAGSFAVAAAAGLHGSNRVKATSLRNGAIDIIAGSEEAADMDLVGVGGFTSSATSGSIISGSTEKSGWGFPNYLRELGLGGPLTWQNFARTHGHLGRTCTFQTALSQCGTGFVCREGVCGECSLSRDCGEHYRCEAPAVFSVPNGESTVHRVCMPRDLIKHWTSWEGLATVLIVFTAVLSAAAGMGGGGVYVPLLLLLLGLSTKEAVPLSQAMIVGGATVNVIMFAGDRHPKYPSRPKIDYGVIMMMNPGLACGVTIGVICNVISPQWLIVLVLLITLAITFQKSITKGISQWNKESKMLEEQAVANSQQGGPSAPGAPGAPSAAKKDDVGIKLADMQTAIILARTNARPLGLIVGCWLTFLAMNFMKAPQCSIMYWCQLAGMMLICVAFTAAGAKTITDEAANSSEDGLIKWTPRTLWLYPLFSTVAGFLGGFLGIGGGIIMGPLLLELNMAAEASQATTALFVFLSSSLATIQFILLGKGMPMYAAWFTSWVILSTFVGQTLVDYLLRKYQRSSVIILSIAGIIAGSLVMMTCIGSYDVYHDYMRGAPMGFNTHHLCAIGRFFMM